MKLLKRIFYILLGLLLVSAISMVGVILYAEYSGRRFHLEKDAQMADAGLPDEESRLAYDENGNLAELPGSPPPQPIPTQEESSAQSGTEAETVPENTSEESGGDVSPGTSAEDSAPPENELPSGNENEQLYIMDMGSALFHTKDCPHVADIAPDQRAERTASSSKIINAGYEPCTNCNP